MIMRWFKRKKRLEGPLTAAFWFDTENLIVLVWECKFLIGHRANADANTPFKNKSNDLYRISILAPLGSILLEMAITPIISAINSLKISPEPYTILYPIANIRNSLEQSPIES